MDVMYHLSPKTAEEEEMLAAAQHGPRDGRGVRKKRHGHGVRDVDERTCAQCSHHEAVPEPISHCRQQPIWVGFDADGVHIRQVRAAVGEDGSRQLDIDTLPRPLDRGRRSSGSCLSFAYFTSFRFSFK